MGEDLNYSTFSSEVEKFLTDGESLYWVGKPHKKLYFRWADLYVSFIGFIWSFFCIYWAIDAIKIHPRGGRDVFGFIFLLFFSIIGLFMFFIRFIFRYLSAKNTYYVVTDRRVFKVNKLFGDSLVNSISLNNIDKIDVERLKDGLFRVTFSPEGYDLREEIKEKKNISDLTRIVIFDNVKNVDEFLNFINENK